MHDPSNLRCHLQLSMRHVETYGLRRVVPYACYVPDGIRVSTVESLSRRLVPAPYERPVGRFDLRLLGYRVVAACHCSLGYTRGVLTLVCSVPRVVSLRVGGYDSGLCLAPFLCRCPVFDSLCSFVSLPRLGLTISPREFSPRVRQSVVSGYFLPACSNVPFPWRRCSRSSP
jgi:hypothetical protein